MVSKGDQFMSPLTLCGNHAVVIGGSIAGLVSTRVLSNYFARVTVIERDHLPEGSTPRKGVPQDKQAHGILAAGMRTLERLFPGFEADLVAAGGLLADQGLDFIWHHFDTYKLRFDADLSSILLSRPLIETTLRRRVLALPNVSILEQGSVSELIHDAASGRVLGVRVARHDRDEVSVEEITAELVVDGSGRGSKTPQWLEKLGYGAPEESSIKVNLAYASRLYHRGPSDFKAIVTAEAPPFGKRGGALMALEDDQWICTLFGYSGDHPPLDEAGFNEFARSLPAPEVYNTIQKAEPLSDIAVYKFPANLRRHYEKMARFPQGYLVLGDALCSFNPIYGQGMSVSILEAEALAATLAEQPNLDNLASHFYQKASPVVDVPWTLASGADLGFAHIEGRRSLPVKLINAYMARVHQATAVDPVVAQAFFNVANLVEFPPVLFKPKLIWRVLRAQKRARTQLSQTKATQPHAPQPRPLTVSER
jgi:2-polyprenyl-6-methoxyphenol hydroxylase-like FAD-dependent oxidoreductase